MVDARVSEKEEGLQSQRESLFELTSLSKMFRGFHTRAKRDHNCPLCTRMWADNHEETNFLQMMATKMHAAPIEIVQREATVNPKP